MTENSSVTSREQGADAIKHPNVNFFTPKNAHSRANMRLICVLVTIWALAVFGFQVLLIALQKPVPEDAHLRFTDVWPAVRDGAASADARVEFARATLMALGKNIVLKPAHKQMLDRALSANIVALLPPDRRAAFMADLRAPDKMAATAAAIEVIGLRDEGFDKLMRGFLPFSLTAVDGSDMDAELRGDLPSVMKLYLVHNRSVLTDFQFLGFPFHYWYTAQFLLIMFVVMCLIYAVLIEKIHARHGFVEE